MDKATKQFIDSVGREMKRQGLTQVQLAERAGMLVAQLNYILQTKGTVTLRMVGRIAEALNVPVSELLAEPCEEHEDDDLLAGLFQSWDEVRRRTRKDPDAQEFFAAFDNLVNLYRKKFRK